MRSSPNSSSACSTRSAPVGSRPRSWDAARSKASRTPAHRGAVPPARDAAPVGGGAESGLEHPSMTTLESLGGAQQHRRGALQSALDALSYDQKDVAGRLFDHLVTPSGTKIAHESPTSPTSGGSRSRAPPRTRRTSPIVASSGRSTRAAPFATRSSTTSSLSRGRLARESRGRPGARTAAGGLRPSTAATARVIAAGAVLFAVMVR